MARRIRDKKKYEKLQEFLIKNLNKNVTIYQKNKLPLNFNVLQYKENGNGTFDIYKLNHSKDRFLVAGTIVPNDIIKMVVDS